MAKNVRNVLIVLGIAALIVLIPGGGKGANTAQSALYLAMLGTFSWGGYVSYRQYHVELHSLEARWRAVLYGAVGLAVLTLAAGSRLRASGGGAIAFYALLALAGALVFSVWQASRRY